MSRRRATGLAMAVLALLALAAPAQATRTVVTSSSGSLGGVESVTAFSANPDGSLTPSPRLPVGARPEGVAITPDARFLYVSTSVAAGVRGYEIGARGTLSQLPGSPFASGGQLTTGIAVSPSGRWLLATNRGTALNDAADPGSVAAYAIDPASGALTPVAGSPFGLAGLEDPTGVAISPDGNRAFVAGDAAGATFSGRVASLSVNQATGALTQVAGSPFASGGNSTFSLVVSPDGARVFAGNVHLSTGNSISVLAVDKASGGLAPAVGSPFATAGRAPIGLGLAPDGGRLYAAERAPASGGNDGVSIYDVAGSGALVAVPGSPFSVGGGATRGVVATPDGGEAYVHINAEVGAVAGLAIGANGVPSPLPGSPYPTGDRFASFLSIAMTPSQTPQPAFDAPVTKEGEAMAFDASATEVPGGEATRYDWDFGDGAVLADGGPTPSHAYAAPGEYTVRLTVANDCGAAAVFDGDTVFTGQTAHCRGPRTATASRTVAVVDTTAPTLSGLAIGRRFAVGAKRTPRNALASARVKRGTGIRFRLSEPAQVKLSLERRLRKRGKGKPRFRPIGALNRSGREGPNRVFFSGRLDKRPLSPGRYRVVATATDSADNVSAPKSRPFRIVRSR